MSIALTWRVASGCFRNDVIISQFAELYVSPVCADYLIYAECINRSPLTSLILTILIAITFYCEPAQFAEGVIVSFVRAHFVLLPYQLILTD